MLQLADADAARLGLKFAGFANNDIVFDARLTATLRAVLQDRAARRFPGGQQSAVLVVGARTNVDRPERFLDTPQQSSNGGVEYTTLDADKVIQAMVGDEATRLMQGGALDYFFWTTGDLEEVFGKVPPFVVGRSGWDTFLLDRALKAPKVTVIDASRTIRAMHLTDSRGNYASEKSERPDVNLKICENCHVCIAPMFVLIVLYRCPCSNWYRA